MYSSCLIVRLPQFQKITIVISKTAGVNCIGQWTSIQENFSRKEYLADTNFRWEKIFQLENFQLLTMIFSENFLSVENFLEWKWALKAESNGIWSHSFGTPVHRFPSWAIKPIGIGGEFPPILLYQTPVFFVFPAIRNVPNWRTIQTCSLRLSVVLIAYYIEIMLYI